MKLSVITGFSFGLTSGIITTLGLIVGLDASTHSKLVIIGGILTIAIADSFSDALGIHISQESQSKHSAKSIWESTISTFLSKLIFASTFIVPILLLELQEAILVSVVWGFLILGIFSYFIAKQNKEKAWKVVGEHLLIALVVVLITRFVGSWIATVFS